VNNSSQLSPDSISNVDGLEDIVVPLHEEKIAVSKRQVATGRVQVSTVTHEHEELVDELLAREQVEIDRVAIDRAVDAIPPVREEGDTIIVPVIEEVLVIERRLHLKEEIRIRRVHNTERHQQRVMVRRQEAVVTRLPVEEQTGEVSPVAKSQGTTTKEK
jgi:stress response protein YsnF